VESSVGTGALASQRTGCIVVGAHDGRKLTPSAKALDAASGRGLDAALKSGDLQGGPGATLLLRNLPGVATERVLLVALGPERGLDEIRYHAALAAAIQGVLATGAQDATLCFEEIPVEGRDGAWKIEQAVRAVMERTYRFDRLKSGTRRAKPPLQKVSFHVAGRSRSATDAVRRGAAIAEGITLAKDLANLPGNICTPAYLAHQAKDLAARHRFKVAVLERKDMAKLGMGSFLAVARGSRQPPKLVVMEYGGGDRAAPPIVLVGKGITFDSGGISIKPAAELDEMKFDMCGAASVMGALDAAARLELRVNVVGIIPAAENMPGGDAMRPGDVVTTMSGRTVEILDTDHEGRLILCDALTYAERFKPAVVIDIATLTDSVVTALGDVATGVFSNNRALARAVVEAGERAWDRAWELPLWDEYQGKLESNFADLPNIGPPGAGAITAACFLSRFGERFPWAHLDIAGTASKSGAEKGATGRPVALLTHFLAAQAASPRGFEP
jgi:leucyl aminopeptidase